VFFADPITVSGRASASSAPTGRNVRIVFVVDGDEDGMQQVESAVIGTEFKWQFIPQELAIENGTHTFALYAIDEDGDISPAQALTVVVKNVREPEPVPEPTAAAAAHGIGIYLGIFGGTLGLIALVSLAFYVRYRCKKKAAEDEAVKPVSYSDYMI
jgi:heme/copper-type cytochrome/quinol oxidase subunit 2